MANEKKPSKGEPAEKQPETAKIAEARELSDDELEEVIGGVSSSDGTVGGSCSPT
jgi:bacteriocin-like protein